MGMVLGLTFNLSILRQTKDKLTMKDELPENEQNRTVEGLSGKNESLCGCGKPVRYLDVSDQNKGSCNKYMRCLTYEEMQETLRGANRMLMAYQVAVNQFDDYFDHINESIKDRKKVHQILGNLTDELKRT